MLDNIFKVVFLAGCIAAWVIRMPHRKRNKQSQIADGPKVGLDKLLLFMTYVGMLVIPILYVFTPWLDFANYRLPNWAGWLGVVTFAVALWLFWRSHTDLGRNWSATLEIREGHSLVAFGVYQYIRHPMYTAHWIRGIAQALLLQNWIAGLANLVPFLPLYLLRVPREEQMMLERFGEEYRSYMNRTGRVVPRPWK